MKLYEIANDYLVLMEAIENGDIPEECIADTLEAVKATLEDKADNIACLLKNIDAEVLAIKAEEKRLAERRKTKQNAYERLKEYLSEQLLKAGLNKIETARNRISFRKNEAVNIGNEDEFVKWALDNRPDLLKFSYEASKTAIKEAIKDGEVFEGAELRTNYNIQIK